MDKLYFRAYDDEKNKMVIPYTHKKFYFGLTSNGLEYYKQLENGHVKNYPLMPSVFKKGRTIIYDGDIIKIKNKIYMDSCGFNKFDPEYYYAVLDLCTLAGTKAYLDIDHKYNYYNGCQYEDYDDSWAFTNFKVVGNIYQNKELLDLNTGGYLTSNYQNFI